MFGYYCTVYCSFLFGSSVDGFGLAPNCYKYLAYHFFLYSFFLLAISAYKASLYSLIDNFLLSFIGIGIFFSHSISSSGQLNSRTYLCFKAYSAVYLLLGLKHNNFFIKSRQSSEAPEKKL